MRRIPIAAAKRLAEEYGYEQVIIIARDDGIPGGWMTTYGKTKKHCEKASIVGNLMVERILGWKASGRKASRGQR